MQYTSRYGSSDFYRVLAAIEGKVDLLACRGDHVDGGVAYKDLANYIRKEREACAVRVARAEAERLYRNKQKEKKHDV